MTIEIHDGQIYRWRWSDKARDADCGPYRSYHCKSQIAVVKNGALFDTFWSSSASDDRLDPKAVDVTFFCEDSWPRIKEYQKPLYDPNDIADTRHSNNGSAPIYLRPGAVKSAASILQEIDYREERAKGEIKSAEWRLENLAAVRKLIAEGRLDEVYL